MAIGASIRNFLALAGRGTKKSMGFAEDHLSNSGFQGRVALYPFSGAVGGALIKGAKFGFGTMTSGAGRIAAGGLAGGVHAVASSDSQNINNQINTFFSGATRGALAAGAFNAGIAKWGSGQLSRGVFQPLHGLNALNRIGVKRGAAKMAAETGENTTKLQRAGLGMKNIGGMAALGAVGVGTTQAFLSSKGSSISMWTQYGVGKTGSPGLTGGRADTNYDRQAVATMNMQTGVSPTGAVGTAPQMMGRYTQALQDSTQGMVQGLHRGRHG